MSDLLRLAHKPDAAGQNQEKVATLLRNEEKIPIVLEFRCRNRECCPRRDGYYAVHLFTLYGEQNGVAAGEYVTEYRQFGDLARVRGT